MRTMTLDEYCTTKGIGSAAELASAVGVSSVLISQWRTKSRPVPANHCPSIERATAGAVRCEDLRPDVDWAYLRNSSAAAGEAA